MSKADTACFEASPVTQLCFEQAASGTAAQTQSSEFEAEAEGAALQLLLCRLLERFCKHPVSPCRFFKYLHRQSLGSVSSSSIAHWTSSVSGRHEISQLHVP